jgi:PKD repeat protein
MGVRFGWSPSTDNVEVAFYEIAKSPNLSAVYATSSIAEYTDNNVAGSATYRVRAVDTSGNRSNWSGTNTFTPGGPSGSVIRLGRWRLGIDFLGAGGVTPGSPPVANFTATPRSGAAPLTVQFTDTSTNNPNGWEWDFQNNGSVDSTAQNPQFVYTTAGTYTVKLTAMNNDGSDPETKTGYITVNVATQVPVAGFTMNPSSGNAPLTVNFTNTSTGSPTPTYKWDFENTGAIDSTATNPSYNYATPDNYAPKLTATNSAGSDTAQQFLIVGTSGGATHTAPASITSYSTASAATSGVDVSAALMDWLNSTGQPGDTLKLRQDVFYKTDFIIYLGTTAQIELQDRRIDLNGAYFVRTTRSTSGSQPSYWRYSSNLWPKNNAIIQFANVRDMEVFSSRDGAGMRGPSRAVELRSSGAPRYGIPFSSSLEAQAGFDITEADNLTIDLSKIEVSFTHGDGVYLGGSRPKNNITVTGDPASTIGGGAVIVGSNPGTWQITDWKPGIHHVARQMIAPCMGSGILIENIAMWQGRRSALDFEPPSSSWLVNNATVQNTRAQEYELTWCAAQGRGLVNNVTLDDNWAGEPINIECLSHVSNPHRQNWTVTNNVSNDVAASGHVFHFFEIDGVHVEGNFQTFPTGSGYPSAPMGQNNSPVYFHDCNSAVEQNNKWPCKTYTGASGPCDVCGFAGPAGQGDHTVTS